VHCTSETAARQSDGKNASGSPFHEGWMAFARRALWRCGAKCVLSGRIGQKPDRLDEDMSCGMTYDKSLPNEHLFIRSDGLHRQRRLSLARHGQPDRL
jgi:hypothetical protein